MTVKQFVSNEDALQMYNILKKVNVQNIQQVTGLDPSNNDAILLFSKIANASTENEFVTALTSGEMPAIKLSAQETEMLKGGANSPVLSCLICPTQNIICRFKEVK